jgi:hypothetical protein
LYAYVVGASGASADTNAAVSAGMSIAGGSTGNSYFKVARI